MARVTIIGGRVGVPEIADLVDTLRVHGTPSSHDESGLSRPSQRIHADPPIVAPLSWPTSGQQASVPSGSRATGERAWGLRRVSLGGQPRRSRGRRANPGETRSRWSQPREWRTKALRAGDVCRVVRADRVLGESQLRGPFTEHPVDPYQGSKVRYGPHALTQAPACTRVVPADLRDVGQLIDGEVKGRQSSRS